MCRVETKSLEVGGEPWSADRVYNVAAKEYIGKDGKDGYVVDTLSPPPHDILMSPSVWWHLLGKRAIPFIHQLTD